MFRDAIKEMICVDNTALMRLGIASPIAAARRIEHGDRILEVVG
jgi:hypothetical protein